MIALKGLKAVDLGQGHRVLHVLQSLLHRHHVHFRKLGQELQEPERQQQRLNNIFITLHTKSLYLEQQIDFVFVYT